MIASRDGCVPAVHNESTPTTRRNAARNRHWVCRSFRRRRDGLSGAPNATMGEHLLRERQTEVTAAAPHPRVNQWGRLPEPFVGRLPLRLIELGCQRCAGGRACGDFLPQGYAALGREDEQLDSSIWRVHPSKVRAVAQDFVAFAKKAVAARADEDAEPSELRLSVRFMPIDLLEGNSDR